MIRNMLAAMLAAASIASRPADEPRVFLASVSSLPIGKAEYVSGFSIDTWGVDFLAVCHIPAGWHITAGSNASPDGTLAGDGSVGASFLDRSRLKELSGLALVKLYGPVQRSEIKSATGVVPATFSGGATVGTYGEDGERKVTITHANVWLTPASRCPASW